MIRHLSDISPSTTSYAAGLKRVLLSANESGCSITQMAVMRFSAGDVLAAHVHPDLQDNFYILSGTLRVTLDGKESVCHAQDFIHVPHGVVYQLEAETDVEMLTCGCVVEAERRKLYPMLFEPNLHEVVWGGTSLKQWKRLVGIDSAPDSTHIGESWEVSAIPSSPSVVSNGTWAGYTLPEVIARRPEAILGKRTAARYGGQLPLLVKFIDAHDDLSIQVHPDDEMAQREHNKMGKSELWYILSAEPDSYIYAGFREEITPEEYRRRVADGTIVDVLARHEVHPGDVFYLPAGRVHAIGRGIRLAEIQQSSDVTYRIYDYGRLGLNGKPRELHTELAAQALNFAVPRDYRTSYDQTPNRSCPIIDSPHFSVRTIDLHPGATLLRDMVRYDSFVIAMCLSGSCRIRIKSTGDEVTLHEGYSCLIPAAIARYDYTPVGGPCQLLESYINNSGSNNPSAFIQAIQRFFHISRH